MLDLSMFIDQDAFGPPEKAKQSPAMTPTKSLSLSALSKLSPTKKDIDSKFPTQDNLIKWWKEEQKNVLETKYSCVHEQNKEKKIKPSTEHKLFPLSAIQTLMSEFFKFKAQGKKLWNNSLSDGAFPLRFVISAASTQLWFAFDGSPNSMIPGHSQMLKKGASKAAGQVFFDENKLICGISNESGNYRPSFISLAWFFAIVYATNNLSKLKDPIFLSWATSSGSTYTQFSLSHEQITELVLALFPNVMLQTLKQANIQQEFTVLKYSPIKNSRSKPPAYIQAMRERFDAGEIPSLIKLSTLTSKSKQQQIKSEVTKDDENCENDISLSAEQISFLGSGI